VKINMNNISKTAKYLISSIVSASLTSNYPKDFQDLASLKTLSNLIALNPEKAPPLVGTPAYLTINSMILIITTTASKILKLSLTYLEGPSPVNLIIISPKKIHDKTSLIFSSWRAPSTVKGC
jgi:hypothetical protein